MITDATVDPPIPPDTDAGPNNLLNAPAIRRSSASTLRRRRPLGHAEQPPSRSTSAARQPIRLAMVKATLAWLLEVTTDELASQFQYRSRWCG
jgi:hypothetical protein